MSAELRSGDALDLLTDIPAGSIDLIVTDPPYVIGAVSAGSYNSKSGTWQDMMNSATWFTAWYREAARVLRHDGAMWTCLNWRTLPVVQRAAMDARLPIASMLVWHKDRIGPGGKIGLRPSYELVALMPKPGFAIPERGIPDVWTIKPGARATDHPAEKPVALMRRLIEVSHVRPDGVILDPFAGSGTTLVAASELGYRSIGIEADGHYADLAETRIAQAPLSVEGAVS